jgi:hypothetical protein
MPQALAGGDISLSFKATGEFVDAGDMLLESSSDIKYLT